MNMKCGVMVLFSVAGLAAVPLVLAGQEQLKPQTQLRNGIVPIGSLSHPLGHYLTIEGVRVEGNKVGVRTFRVDTVNGRKLPEPVLIWIENLDLPEAKRCVLKGYENGGMIGLPPALVAESQESGKEISLPQAGWQMRMFFEVMSVVSPNELRIREGGRKGNP